ncbi:hypothetical protein [Agrobacterium sp. rho-13.3]|uniref:hypothetical protein n=1 Tax=Agrobacterium sp. rho-13.3 TaxID=3072980 RepID=UPI002A105650|nr:hypothetical protein [Agrobacterium sp. rho-13.3]MDX8306825.1 hypothetical protein [Agrobacterium sp. rho-13.3]MDX8306844.1 hypothetical protein [Agrobacterium sp. rho-13.3]
MDETLARSQILLGSMPPREVQNLPMTFHVNEANTAALSVAETIRVDSFAE